MGHYRLLVTKTNKIDLQTQLKQVHDRWDWCEVGGRYAGYFLLKSGASGKRGQNGALNTFRHADGVDIVKVKDIDWHRTEAANCEQANTDWNRYEAEKAADSTAIPRAFDIRPGETKLQYLRRRSSVATFAVLHDGQWYEQTSLEALLEPAVDEKALSAWEAQFEGIIQSLAPDDEVTLVDCHFC